jgi:hypothetical protein
MDEWMDRWMDVRAILGIAYTNQKLHTLYGHSYYNYPN